MLIFRTFLLCVSLAGLAASALPAQDGSPVASAGTPVASAAEKIKIFSGGPVITMDKMGKMVEAQAIAVHNGTIIAVGDDARCDEICAGFFAERNGPAR